MDDISPMWDFTVIIFSWFRFCVDFPNLRRMDTFSWDDFLSNFLPHFRKGVCTKKGSSKMGKNLLWSKFFPFLDDPFQKETGMRKTNRKSQKLSSL